MRIQGHTEVITDSRLSKMAGAAWLAGGCAVVGGISLGLTASGIGRQWMSGHLHNGFATVAAVLLLAAITLWAASTRDQRAEVRAQRGMTGQQALAAQWEQRLTDLDTCHRAELAEAERRHQGEMREAHERHLAWMADAGRRQQDALDGVIERHNEALRGTETRYCAIIEQVLTDRAGAEQRAREQGRTEGRAVVERVDLAEIERQAREQGRAEGRTEGYAEGYADGILRRDEQTGR